MQRTFIFLLGVVFSLGVSAQPYWVRDVGGVGNDHVADVKVDGDGSIYMTGEFGGTMSLGGQTYTSSGSIDLFVARLDQAGEVIWFKTGGGAGIDRGLKVALGANDRLTVAGEFLGTATFQGQTMTSAGGTADMFVAVLNKADGQLQWIRQGGGSTGTDRPYGVSIAGDGSVSVAGEFRGSATWSGTLITSANDPSTGLPDSDVFIATYSSTGDLQWLKQGRAKYADRAIDVVHDGGGNVYVTGQFSDTITFDMAHPTSLMNATFLVKLNSQGEEVWFRHMGGAGFNHVRDMALKEDGRLLLVGDVQGTMIYFGASQTNVNSGEPYAYYVLDVDQNGVLQANTTVGSTSGVSVAGVSVQGNSLAVIGQFNCRFTDLSALYGPGVFMAVGPEDLFVAKHATSGLALLEGQQFGGRSAKSASAIAHLSTTQVVFTGSYQGNLIFPAETSMGGDISTSGGLEGNGISTYCNDANYGRFVGNTASALTDGFIARGYVPGRQPYDWWRRTDNACQRVELEPCIRQSTGASCEDTLRACGSLLLSADLRFSNSGGQTGNFLGPAVTYQWSSGSNATSMGVVSTGTYWVRITSVNGCYTWTDSIHVIIDPAPPIPLISDDVVLNTAANITTTIELCDPETHWVWTPNGGNTGAVHWRLPDGTQVMNDSVRVDTSGQYTVVTVASNGCTRQNVVNVIDHPMIELPLIEADLAVFFPDDLDGDDTLRLCPGGGFEYMYRPTWTVNGVAVAELPEGLLVTWGFSIPVTGEGDSGSQSTMLSADGSGWVVRDLVVMVSNKPCGEDSVLFFKSDSIYVDVFDAPNVQVSIAGPNVICDGDSAILTAQCTGCDVMQWSGQNFEQLAPDSILVFGPGTYSIQGSAESVEGCSSSGQASISMTMPTGFVLGITPGDGIICPGQSATLSTTGTGNNHVWYGPEGAINGQGPSLVTSVAGDYYLVMDIGGCSVTSNSATLVTYGTPYLNGAPRSVLCSLDDEVELVVVATPGATIVWNAPLAGSDVTQPIDEPGTYTCSVTSCGITTELSIVVTLNIVEAALSTPGPFTLCNGDSVLLQGTTDQLHAHWMPGAITGNSTWVSTTGSYYMVASDDAGCRDSTAVVQVLAVAFPDPVQAANDTVCSGDAVHLLATGSGNIAWYADEAATTLLNNGASYTFVPTTSTAIYAVQSQSGCTGSALEVTIAVLPRPAPLTISGPSVVCEGSAINVSVVAPDTVSLLWTTPSGAYTDALVTIPAAGLDDSGSYTCVAVYGSCNSAAVSLNINVAAPESLSLPDEALLCTGGAVNLAIPADFTGVLWSTGNTSTAILVTTGQEITVEALDPNGCAASAQVLVIEDECDLVVPNIFTPNSDGQNDTWLPTGGFVTADARIFNRWGNLVFEGDMVARPWNGKHYQSSELCSDGVYYYVLQFKRVNGSTVERTGYVHLNH